MTTPNTANDQSNDSPTIVILAAGVGARLMPLTRNTPKSLLDLGGGYSLLETQLQSIEQAGGKKVLLVIGYKAEQIEAKVHDYSGPLEISTVYNPFYRLANNIVSAWMGLNQCTGSAIILNGDDTFSASVMTNLLNTQSDISMVVSRKGEYDDDDMKVIIQGDRVSDVGKDIPLANANGESIGMIHFRGLGLTAMINELEQMIRKEENLQTFYLQALRNLMRQQYVIEYSECQDDEWCEVDFHPDLDEMRTQLQERFRLAVESTEH